MPTQSETGGITSDQPTYPCSAGGSDAMRAAMSQPPVAVTVGQADARHVEDGPQPASGLCAVLMAPSVFILVAGGDPRPTLARARS